MLENKLSRDRLFKFGDLVYSEEFQQITYCRLWAAWTWSSIDNIR